MSAPRTRFGLPQSGVRADRIAQEALARWEPGDPYFETTYGQSLVNIAASGAPNFMGQMYSASVVYDVTAAFDSGVAGTITPSIGVTLPVGAIIYGGLLEVITVPVGVGASIAVQSQGAGDLQAAAAISGAPWSTLGIKAIAPVCTAATAVAIATTAKAVKVVVSAANLTAGKFKVHLLCFLGG